MRLSILIPIYLTLSSFVFVPNQSIQSILTQFTNDLAKRGLDVDTSTVDIYVMNELVQERWGECQPGYRTRPLILIKRSIIRGPHLKRILYHELGHCLLHYYNHTKTGLMKATIDPVKDGELTEQDIDELVQIVTILPIGIK